MVEFYLLTFPRFPLRKKEHKSYFGKNRTHDFRTSRCAAYLLDHSGDERHYQMQILLLVTKRYEGQRVTSWRQPATQTNRDLNRDKILARSNQPRTSETCRRQDDVFGYKLQFLLSGVLLISQYNLQRRLSDVLPPFNKVIKNDTRSFLALGGLHEDKLCDTL